MVDSQPPIKTIADVDAFIEKGPVPTHATVSLNPLELRFLERSRIQGKLLYLKCLFREHPAVEQHFTAIRECQLHAAPSAGRVHLRSYEHAFGELDRTCGGCFGGGKIRTFLDLGCSPGGFSSWILKHNRSATGVGITLPDADAKWAMPDDMISMPDRYRVQFDDLNNLTMCAITEGREPLIDQTNQASSAPTHGGFDLVIAGAFPTLSGRISWFVRARLFFSQLLIVLSNLAQGGSCVVCINAKPFLWIVDAIGMLRRYFTDIGASKAGKLHSVRTSCYLVCRNFGASEEELQLCTSWLHDVLRRLDGMSETPADAPDTGSPHTEEDDRQDEEQDGESPEGSLPLFGGASMSEIFDMQHRFVLDLFEPIWALQYNSIRDRFAQVLEEDSLGYDVGVCRCPSARPRAGSVTSPPLFGRRPTISVYPSTRGSGASNAYGSPPVHSPLQQDHDSPTSPVSSHIPKWRPPQRRKTFSESPSDARDWRRRSTDKSVGTHEQPPVAAGDQSAPKSALTRRRFSSVNSTGADTNGSWRWKK